MFKYIPGVEFDFRFQYLNGNAGSSNPINLSGYTGQWIITDSSGSSEYGMGAPGHSGIFFGGDNDDVTNGVIDLVLTANDTTALFTPARYQFLITPNGGSSIPLLFGGMINANAALFVGAPPPSGSIDGGNASSDFSITYDGGSA